MNPVHSASRSQDTTFGIPQARDYVAKLSHDSEQEMNPMLKRLKRELVNAIASTEAAHQSGAPFEVCLEQQSHLIWLCNQCDYYIATAAQSSSPVSAVSSTANRRPHRALRQIRAVVATLIVLKLINHVQRLLPGSTPPAPAWRDILPGVRLWTMGSGRRD